MFYNPKAFFTHAALRRQAFAHCERFSTAASRRSLGSVSVPVWPVTLSGRLPIVALVSRYLTNKLIGRGLIFTRQARRSPPLIKITEVVLIIFGISYAFAKLSPMRRYITHVLLTLTPLSTFYFIRRISKMLHVRLACLIHAASVRSEPGSNSP